MSGPPVTSGGPSVPTGVLRTKLTVPRLWPGALTRSALVDHLNGAGVPGRLTLMVAGAGWGKSTLLAQWHNQDPHPERFAWLSIESADNDSTRLLRWSSTYYAGDMDTALGCAQRVLQLLADDPVPWHANAQLALGFCLYRKRRFREVQTALSTACALAEEGRDDLTATAAYGTQAVIAAASDRHRDAERLAARAEHYGHQHAASDFTRALELLRRGPLRVDTSEVLTALAMAHQQLGNVESASEHLAEARSILEQCPDPGYLLADPRTLRLPRRTSTVSDHPANLSDREGEVLGLVGEGLITDDIACRLRLSPRTVDAHLRSIYRKINVKTRAAASYHQAQLSPCQHETR